MEQNKNKANEFLKKHKMDAGSVDMENCCDTFLKEMEQGLADKGSTLKMIPTYIETEKNVPTDNPVIVMDAGGTNFRVAVVQFKKDGHADISDFQLFEMPGIEREVGKKEFFEIMAGYVRGVIDKSPDIGFCFSYPAEIFPNKDGKLIHFSKEIPYEQFRN